MRTQEAAPRKKNNLTAAITPTQPISPYKPEKSPFYNVPDSTASNLIMETLNAGADIGDLPARKGKVSHSSTLTVVEDKKRRQVSLQTAKASVTVELADIDKLTGSNKAAKKLFVLALIKANQQAIHDGTLTRNYVSFPLQELIDTGFYKTPQSARTGFKSGMDALTSLKVKGHIQQTKKKSSSIEALEVLFTGARIERGQCTIYFNDRISWSFIAQYFTILPLYYFRLPNRASDLLYYIFYLARQHTGKEDIKTVKDEDTGREELLVSFNISFRAIQARLQLPSEVGNTRPKQTIRDPIEEAIEQIETEHSEVYGNTQFRLFPVYDEAASIAEYLDNGYLRVELLGEFGKSFVEISQDTAKQIENAQKRQERITEKAISINMAKKLEAEENPSTEGATA